MYRETPALAPFDQHVQTTNYLADRLSGFLVMFNPRSDLSFVSSFGLAALLVPVAAIYVIWRRKWNGGWLAAVAATSGAMLCATLLDAHNRFFLEWLFGYRHGLPFILLLIVATVQMTGRYARIVAIALVAISVITAVPRVFAFATEPPPDWPSSAEKQFASWMHQHDSNAIVLTTNAQALAVVSRANFRWTTCEQPSADVRRVLQLVRTDYVLVYEQEQRCPFATGLNGLVTAAGSFGDAPNRILLLKVHR